MIFTDHFSTIDHAFFRLCGGWGWGWGVGAVLMVNTDATTHAKGGGAVFVLLHIGATSQILMTFHSCLVYPKEDVVLEEPIPGWGCRP